MSKHLLILSTNRTKVNIHDLYFRILFNIDVFPAGISETPTPDGQIGPLFTCIVGEQMDRLKNGDRFYFMFEDAGFTPGTHSWRSQNWKTKYPVQMPIDYIDVLYFIHVNVLIYSPKRSHSGVHSCGAALWHSSWDRPRTRNSAKRLLLPSGRLVRSWEIKLCKFLDMYTQYVPLLFRLFRGVRQSNQRVPCGRIRRFFNNNLIFENLQPSNV